MSIGDINEEHFGKRRGKNFFLHHACIPEKRVGVLNVMTLELEILRRRRRRRRWGTQPKPIEH